MARKAKKVKDYRESDNDNLVSHWKFETIICKTKLSSTK